MICCGFFCQQFLDNMLQCAFDRVFVMIRRQNSLVENVGEIQRISHDQYKIHQSLIRATARVLYLINEKTSIFSWFKSKRLLLQMSINQPPNLQI